MTKAQLLAALAAAPFSYIGIGTPENPNGEGVVNGITKYIVNVFEVGKSQTTKQPTGYRKNVTFYVYHEGLGDEAAYFELIEPVNASNTDTSVASASYANMANIYNSKALQDRVTGALITYCVTVFMEDPGTTNHANRMLLVAMVNKDLRSVVMRFMTALAYNSTVQTQGNDVTDSTILGIVSGSWDSFANLQATYYSQLANTEVVYR